MTAQYEISSEPEAPTAQFVTWFNTPRKVLHRYAMENPGDYLSVAENVIPNMCSPTATCEEVYTETFHLAVYGQEEILAKRAIDFFAEYNSLLAFIGI